MVGDSAPAHNAGLTLAEQMIEAHGGAALWNRLQAVQVRDHAVHFGSRQPRLPAAEAAVRRRRNGQRVRRRRPCRCRCGRRVPGGTTEPAGMDQPV